MFKKLFKNQLGVTLLEIVVSVTLFSFAIISATAIFQLVVEGQRNAIAGQNIQESLRYSLEVMSKEVRMAQRDKGVCASVPDNDVYATNAARDRLYFKNYNGVCASYYLSGNTLVINRGADTASTTPNTVKVSNLSFTADNGFQPKTTLKMEVEATGKALHKQFMKIQTTLSSRAYN